MKRSKWDFPISMTHKTIMYMSIWWVFLFIIAGLCIKSTTCCSLSLIGAMVGAITWLIAAGKNR